MMVRVVKAADVRQDEILDVAMRLFMTRGYVDTPIQAIIDEVGIAKGTFYHHFKSKSELLDALVRRMVDQSLSALRPILDEPGMTAIDRLNALYQTAQQWKADRRELLLDLRRALDIEANLPLLQRIERDSKSLFVPMVQRVIEAGVASGELDARYPAHAAAILHDLGMALGLEMREALFGRVAPDFDELREQIDAFHDAAERLLGAPRGSIHLVDIADVRHWIEAMNTGRYE